MLIRGSNGVNHYIRNEYIGMKCFAEFQYLIYVYRGTRIGLMVVVGFLIK